MQLVDTATEWLTRDPSWWAEFQLATGFFLIELLLVVMLIPILLSQIEKARRRRLGRRWVSEASDSLARVMDDLREYLFCLFRHASIAPVQHHTDALEKLPTFRRSVDSRIEGMDAVDRILSGGVGPNMLDDILLSAKISRRVRSFMDDAFALAKIEATIETVQDGKVIYGFGESREIRKFSRGAFLGEMNTLRIELEKTVDRLVAAQKATLSRNERNARREQIEQALGELKGQFATVSQRLGEMEPINGGDENYLARRKHRKNIQNIDDLVAEIERQGT